MKEQEHIRQLVEAQLSESPYFVVDVYVSGSRTTPKVTITLDGDTGIGIDTCADISRDVDNKIEEDGLFPKGYVLEVSSPGIDQPLKLVRQYPKHIGRQIRIHLKDGNTREGKLEAVDNESIIFQEKIVNKANKKKKELVTATVAILDIDKAFVLVSFK